MTPDQVKVSIKRRYERLKDRANRGEINNSCIERIIQNEAREGARHNGIPECWRHYLPEELQQ